MSLLTRLPSACIMKESNHQEGRSEYHAGSKPGHKESQL